MVIQKLNFFLQNNVEPKIRKFFLFSLFDLSVGVVGMLVYGILTSSYGPIWIRNQYFGLWLTTLVFFYSIQSIYIELKKWNKRINYISDIIFIIISIILQFLMCIFYGLAKKIDVIIWSIYIFAVNLTNLYILVIRRKSCFWQKCNQNEENTDAENSLNKEVDTTENSKKIPILLKVLRVINFVLKIFFIIVQCFLLNGAITDGVGNAKYQNIYSKLIDVALNDNTGRTVKINYFCDGPVDATKTLLMFEADGSHG